MFDDEFDAFDEEWSDFDEEWDDGIDDEVAESLALELLDIDDEDDLDEFLGSLFKGAAKAAGGLLKSSVGKKLVGAAKSVTKRALPELAAKVGGHFGRQADQQSRQCCQAYADEGGAAGACGDEAARSLSLTSQTTARQRIAI